MKMMKIIVITVNKLFILALLMLYNQISFSCLCLKKSTLTPPKAEIVDLSKLSARAPAFTYNPWGFLIKSGNDKTEPITIINGKKFHLVCEVWKNDPAPIKMLFAKRGCAFPLPQNGTIAIEYYSEVS